MEELGDLHVHAAAYSSAVEYYRSALHAIRSGVSGTQPSHLPETAIRRKIAECLSQQGQFDEALAELDVCGRLLEGGSAREVAIVKIRRARILSQQAHYEQAIRLGREAFSVLAVTELHREVGMIQVLLGNCHLRLGLAEKAEEFYQDALATYRRVGDRLSEAHVLFNLAFLAHTACRWNRALQLYERAEQLFRTHGATHEFCSLHLNKGILFRKMGNRAEALAHAQRGVQLARNLGGHARLAKFRLLLGQLQIDDGRTVEAEQNLLEAKVLAERSGSIRELALADEFLGDLMVARGRFDEAELNYGLAAGWARQISEANDILAEILRRRAELALARGHASEALALAEAGLALVDACGEEYERGFLERTRGTALLSEGRLDEVEQAYQRAITCFRAHRIEKERAGTLQLLAEFHLHRGGREQLLIARSRLQEALELDFVEAAGTQCHVHLLLARVELELGNCDDALLSLFELERLSCCRNEELDEQVESLRVRIESAMASQAQSISSQYRMLADLPGILADDEVPGSKGLDSVLMAVAERLRAQRGLVALRDKDKGVRVWAQWNLARRDAKRLAECGLRALAEGEESEAPRVWTHTHRDPIWRDAIDHDASPLTGAVAFGLEYEDHLQGIFYFDADTESQDGITFQGDSLAMASTYVHLVRSTVLADLLQASAEPARGAAPTLEAAFEPLITRSDCMMEVLSLCSKVAPSPYTVLFTGETGTGKGLLARIVHELSPRQGHPLVTVNCAAMPETLLESELFGYVKGAFTGADRNKEGLILAAERGTLFLDEIGKMSLPMQAKLLHVLDTKEVRPVGGTSSRHVDVRVLCATKHDLREMVERDEFLEDLYYRLLDFPIVVPPLRTRGDDVLLLARHYVDGAAAELGRAVPRMTRSFVSKIRAYAWPGNVRELEKAIKRAVILAGEDSKLRDAHLPTHIRSGRSGRSGDEVHSDLAPLKEQIAQLEKSVLQTALDRMDWNRARVARELKISYPTLLQKIRLYGLRPL